MNVSTLVGRLTSDVRSWKVGQNAITKSVFRIAAEDSEGKTDFINVETLGKTAEFCEKYLTKGRKISVVGKIVSNRYQNKEGQMINDTHVFAHTVRAEDSKKPTEEVAYQEDIDDDEVEIQQGNEEEEF